MTLTRYLPILLLLVATTASAADDCIPCHREKTPAAVRQWEASAHARAGVGCAACHGSDHDRIVKGEVSVDAKTCGRCHQKAYDRHLASRHGMGLHSGWGCTRNLPERDPAECRFCHEKGSAKALTGVQCARFLKQSSEMGATGCNRCHSVERSCASCHTNHMTDLAIVRNPNVCAKCHMGPDHPQWEMWQTSQHGTLYASDGPSAGPTCQTCHMAGGDHDVSRGITMSSGGTPYPSEKAEPAREEMVTLCSRCHASSFARKELDRDDAVRTQSAAILKEAEAIIWDLSDHGLLDPMPADRPPHPLRGKVLVTDGQMLYEDTSHIERLYFKMMKYDFARTVKGAYHQNPAYTHWYGNAELKMDLIDIKAEANRLRERKAGGAGLGASAAPTTEMQIEERLKALKNRVSRGAISEAEYEKEKATILKELPEKGR